MAPGVRSRIPDPSPGAAFHPPPDSVPPRGAARGRAQRRRARGPAPRRTAPRWWARGAPRRGASAPAADAPAPGAGSARLRARRSFPLVRVPGYDSVWSPGTGPPPHPGQTKGRGTGG